MESQKNLEDEFKLGASNEYIAKLISACAKHCNKFLGVVSMDQLKCEKDVEDIKDKLTSKSNGTSVIFNTSTMHEKGQHWLMLTKITKTKYFLFDSFGTKNFPLTNYGSSYSYMDKKELYGFHQVKIVINKNEKRDAKLSKNEKLLKHFLFSCLRNCEKLSCYDQLQSPSSNLCGFYCMFVQEHFANQNSINTADLFCYFYRNKLSPTRQEENDKIIKNWFKEKTCLPT